MFNIIDINDCAINHNLRHLISNIDLWNKRTVLSVTPAILDSNVTNGSLASIICSGYSHIGAK